MRILLFIFLSLTFVACSSNESNSSTPNTTAVSTSNTSAASSTQGPVIDSGTKYGPTKIDVTVEGMSGGNAYLIGMYTDQNYRVDSVGVDRQGRFTFDIEEGLPAGLYFVVFQDNRNFQLILDKDQVFSVKTRNNSLGSVEVTGNKASELLYETRNVEAPINNSLSAVEAQLREKSPSDSNFENFKTQKARILAQKKEAFDKIFNANPDNFFTIFKKAGQNPNVDFTYDEMGEKDMVKYLWDYRQNYWADVNFNDGRLLRTPVIQNKLKNYINKLTIQHPDSLKISIDFLMNNVMDSPEYYKYFANWIAINFEPTETKLMDSQAIYVHMVTNYFTPEKAVWSTPAEIQALQNRAGEMRQSLVGLAAPDVVSTNPSGQTKSIYEMNQDYIVVYMYNPECEHCQEETPKLLNYYNQMNKKELGVFAIAIDTDDTKWKNYISKAGIQKWVNVHDPTNQSIYGKYFVDVTPELYLLNPDRKIIGKNLKTHQVQEMIDMDKNRR